MATINSFEDMELWKRARAFAHQIFEISSRGSFANDYSLKNQINASSGSIMDNIAEGFERDGRKEFILFLSYSKGSAGESRSQLYRAFDREHVNEDLFLTLKEEAISISKMLSGFISYLKTSDIKGLKFSEPSEEYKSFKESGNASNISEI